MPHLQEESSMETTLRHSQTRTTMYQGRALLVQPTRHTVAGPSPRRRLTREPDLPTKTESSTRWKLTLVPHFTAKKTSGSTCAASASPPYSGLQQNEADGAKHLVVRATHLRRFHSCRPWSACDQCWQRGRFAVCTLLWYSRPSVVVASTIQWRHQVPLQKHRDGNRLLVLPWNLVSTNPAKSR